MIFVILKNNYYENKTKQFLLILLACLCFPFAQLWGNPVNGLLERIDPGASKKFIIQLKKGQSDFFELDQKGDKVVIRGNNYVNIATGLNWYLKYYAGIHLSWNGMTAKLPESLPFQLLHLFLYHGFLGLETLGKGNRLDGTARNQLATGSSRSGMRVEKHARKIRVYERRNQ